MSDRLTILYFAWLRDRIGMGQQTITMPEGVHTVADLLDYLQSCSAGHAAALQNHRLIRCAINQEFADASAPVTAGDEVAFFPPVTGG